MANALDRTMPGSAAACKVTARLLPANARPLAQIDFDTLYEEYAEFVWRNARRLGVYSAALDDVVQDVFLVAHRRLCELTTLESLRSWMFGILVRVVRDHRRRVRRKEPHQRAAADATDPDQLADARGHGPQAVAEQTDAVRLLYRMLGALDDAKREVFVLAELEEMTEPEISDTLGENVNTVHSRLRAARRDFDQAVLRHRSRDEWRLR